MDIFNIFPNLCRASVEFFFLFTLLTVLFHPGEREFSRISGANYASREIPSDHVHFQQVKNIVHCISHLFSSASDSGMIIFFASEISYSNNPVY